MSRQGSAAFAGVSVGVLYAAARGWNDLSRRTRRAQDDADDAQSTANDALSLAQSLAESGDIKRIGADNVSDLLAGVAYPVRMSTESPAPFATVPTLLPRPILTEDEAAAATMWPPATNAYNSNGDIIEPSMPIDGMNFLTGLSLGYGENRAFLLGLTQPSATPPSEAVLRQYFRYGRAIALQLSSIGSSATPFTEADYAALVQRLFFGGPFPGGVALSEQRIALLAADSAIVSGAAVEAELFRLAVPAGSLKKIGDTIAGFATATTVGVNAGDTHRYRVRLDSTSGNVLYDTGAIAAVFSQAVFNIQMMARAVSATGQVIFGGSASYSTTTTPPAPAFQALDTTIDHALVVTVLHSTNNAANNSIGRGGELVLQAS